MRPTARHPTKLSLFSVPAPYVPPVLICLCVLSIPWVPQLRFTPAPGAPIVRQQTPHLHRVRPLQAGSAEELLDRLGQAWAGSGGWVPGLAPSRFPPDLEQLPVADRKEVFFRSLLPHVLDHNDRIAEKRVRLEELSAGTTEGADLGEADRRFLGGLAERYRLDADIAHPAEQIQVLLGKVDIVPPSIALAQAAIESAWGTSRFARLGNNLFGQWVFDRDRGIAPLERPDGANYSLARFQNLGDAVDAYLRNLNGYYAYEEFRRLRRQMRSAGEPLDPYRLAGGLRSYSTRRGEYVREIRSVIRGNDLTRFDGARLYLPPDETRLL